MLSSEFFLGFIRALDQSNSDNFQSLYLRNFFLLKKKIIYFTKCMQGIIDQFHFITKAFETGS